MEEEGRRRKAKEEWFVELYVVWDGNSDKQHGCMANLRGDNHAFPISALNMSQRDDILI